MRMLSLQIIVLFSIMLNCTINAEEKKIKLRGIDKSQKFEEVQ